MSENPYESPQGTEAAEADGRWFPWPRLRRLIWPLLSLSVAAAVLLSLVLYVRSGIQAAREDLKRTRAESVARLRHKVRQPEQTSSAGSLSGNAPANQP